MKFRPNLHDLYVGRVVLLSVLLVGIVVLLPVPTTSNH